MSFDIFLTFVCTKSIEIEKFPNMLKVRKLVIEFHRNLCKNFKKKIILRFFRKFSLGRYVQSSLGALIDDHMTRECICRVFIACACVRACVRFNCIWVEVERDQAEKARVVATRWTRTMTDNI